MKRVLLAAGGTGGHIFPAISFGQWIEREHPEAEVLYVSGSRKLEAEIYSSFGLRPHVLPLDGSPLGKMGLAILTRTFDLGRAMIDAMSFTGRYRPDASVIFGGYVSAPIFFAMKMRGIRMVAHEQNARAGRMTKIAARLGTTIAAGWNECQGVPAGRFKKVGIPTRSFEIIDRADALSRLGAERFAGRTVVVEMTGSLGSDKVMAALASIAGDEAVKDGFAFIAVGGREEIERENVIAVPLMWDPAPLFSAADILIARAGASTLAEAYAADIPCITVPWHGAADGHQMMNARCFADSPKRKIWDEAVEEPQMLVQKLIELQNISKNTKEKMYNKSEEPCKDLWDLLSIDQERRDPY